jgi:hypothetical protein
VDTNQGEHSEPKTTTPEKVFLFSSKRSTDELDFAEKKKILLFHDKSELHDWRQSSSFESRMTKDELRRTKRETNRPCETKKRKGEKGDLKLEANGTRLHAPPLLSVLRSIYCVLI